MMGEGLLRIGEVASRSGVSRRTVDFYTSMGLLTPASRSGGNFRLYYPTDVQRIAAIRRLEAQGLRLDEITRLLADRTLENHTGGTHPAEDPCPDDPPALKECLASLDAQVLALRKLPLTADNRTRGVLTTLVTRAQVLIATALVLSEEVLPGAGFLPPV